MYFDTPRDFIGGLYEELVYGDQPLGWHIIGRKETVRALLEGLLDYYGVTVAAGERPCVRWIVDRRHAIHRRLLRPDGLGRGTAYQRDGREAVDERPRVSGR